MSGRLLKKVLQEHEESKLQKHHEEEEDEEEEEQESGARSSINPFDLLNDGDEDPEEIEVDDETIVEKKNDEDADHQSRVADHVQQPVSKNKSKKKKKKKNKESGSNVAKAEITLDETLEALGLSANSKQDKVQETKANADSSKKASSRFVLEVDPKYLNLENELRRMYGSKAMRSFESESGSQGGGSSRQVRGGRRGVHHITKTVLISPKENWSRWDRSFSMEFLETKDGNNYFRYTHSSSYEQAQRAFQAAQAIHDLNGVASVLIHHPYHIESLITMADYFKFVGEHDMAADSIGKCLYGLERAWHPMFTPFQGNCRLEFTHETNKLFFKTLFTHMRNMDRRGCHRSALEVCKFLLSLDMSDPVGALFCVDYFALRAEEYAWLEQFSEEYRNDNSLWLFPNFSYSLAIARVYLEKMDSSSSSEATHVDTSKSSSLDLMTQALKLHPTVLKKLVDKVPLKDQAWAKILKHSYFRSDESKIPSLDHLINIYVERNYLIWRLPDVQKLLRSAADLVIESLEQNRTEAESWLCVRKEAFSAENNQYSHLSTHDFSDSMPTLPPDNLQNFVADPRMVGGEQMEGGGGGQQQAPPRPRDVANRNPFAVLFESILPWANFGDEDDEIAHDGHHQPDNNG
ncbi:Transcription factor 25 [Arabidopsis suecica]|uniref:Transcription factor 25 n=1 Tax=Arabidopsis suecica TaxID=45249 RepID=A0A8T2AQJ5_ARASU|nr:Transcription factor 25 [Arabidopsis suecica]